MTDGDKWLVSDSGQPVATNCYDDDHIGDGDIATDQNTPLETDQTLRITED